MLFFERVSIKSYKTDSVIPVVRRVLDKIGLSTFSIMVGSIDCTNICFNSIGTPGITNIIVSLLTNFNPRAEPFGLEITSPTLGTMAWLLIDSEICFPIR